MTIKTIELVEQSTGSCFYHLIIPTMEMEITRTFYRYYNDLECSTYQDCYYGQNPIGNYFYMEQMYVLANGKVMSRDEYEWQQFFESKYYSYDDIHTLSSSNEEDREIFRAYKNSICK